MNKLQMLLKQDYKLVLDIKFMTGTGQRRAVMFM